MKKKLLILSFIFILSIVSLAFSKTNYFNFKTKEDFAVGTTLNLKITSEGLKPTNTSQKIYALESEILWSAISKVTEDKTSIFLGTGNNGDIFSGTEKKLLVHTDEIGITSFLIKDNFLYAGTYPRGRIYQINLTDNSHKIIAKFKEQYIWGLETDNLGNLLVATGYPANLYRLNKNNEKQLIFSSTENHIISIHKDKKGNIFFGGEGEGKLYQLLPSGKVGTIFTSPYKEIHSITSTDDILFFSASGVPNLQSAAATKSSAIYYYNYLDRVNKLVTLPEDMIYSLLVVQNSNKDKVLLAATGHNSTIYEINLKDLNNADNEKNILLKAEASDITNIFSSAEQIFYTTSNPSGLYILRQGADKKGEFTSNILDCKDYANFGNVYFEGSGNIQVLTRSGNSLNPDSTWSDWSSPLKKSAEKITSPSARYLQFKIILTNDDRNPPNLKSITIAYSPKNHPPKIDNINIISMTSPLTQMQLASGSVTATRTQSPAAGAQQQLNYAAPQIPPAPQTPPGVMQRNKLINLAISDEDNDVLMVAVYIRKKNQPWILYNGDLSTTSFYLDTLVYPDGEYQLKFTSDDSPSNAPENTFFTEKISEVFIIDNTPPTINLKSNKKNNFIEISGEIIDNLSKIFSLEYSLDGKIWRALNTVDGILDDKKEEISLKINANSKLSFIRIKAVDEEGNVSVGSLEF